MDTRGPPWHWWFATGLPAEEHCLHLRIILVWRGIANTQEGAAIEVGHSAGEPEKLWEKRRRWGH